LERGRCRACDCEEYTYDGNANNCEACQHKPVAHAHFGTAPQLLEEPPKKRLATDPTQHHINQQQSPNPQNSVSKEENFIDPTNPINQNTAPEKSASTKVQDNNNNNLNNNNFCAYPGCKKPGFVHDGVTHPFCGRVHAREHVMVYPAPLSINFYNHNEPYYEFSNFYIGQPVMLHDKFWPTTEHFYQAMKFQGSALEEQVRNLPTPRDAFEFSRRHANEVRKDWLITRDSVMHEAVLAKFQQDPVLLVTLLDTRDAFLVEHTRNDAYWGDGGDGSGANKLGHTLMKVREHIATQQQKRLDSAQLHSTQQQQQNCDSVIPNKL